MLFRSTIIALVGPELLDPTGAYSNIRVFADDGILYREESVQQFTFTFNNRSNIQSTIDSSVEAKLKMTLILPVWNEEDIILSKLENLASQEYPRKDLELLIIDSASTDESMAIAKSWLKEKPKAFPNYKIIEMEKRLGKTEAIRQAIIAADEKSEVIDADSSFMGIAFFSRGRPA